MRPPVFSHIAHLSLLHVAPLRTTGLVMSRSIQTVASCTASQSIVRLPSLPHTFPSKPQIANYVDAYAISPTAPYLTYHSSHSIVPSSLRDTKPSAFRGDTLLVSPSTNVLFTTTRGSITQTRGWLSVFALDEDGFFHAQGVERYETPTSGGRAHAIDLLPKSAGVVNDTDPILFGAGHVDSVIMPTQAPFAAQVGLGREAVWILLTDDDDSVLDNGGGVRVLEWDGWGSGGFKEVTAWPDPLSPDQESKDVKDQQMLGGSHAIWL